MCTGYDETRFFKHMTSATSRRAAAAPADEDRWQDAIDTGSVSSYSIMMTGAAAGQAAAENASVNVENVFSYMVSNLSTKLNNGLLDLLLAVMLKYLYFYLPKGRSWFDL